MITPDYCRMMAQYNSWQNAGLRRMLPELDDAELRKERGAFFGSIFATANHLLWGDLRWMSLFDGGEGPAVEAKKHTDLTPTVADWARLRYVTDGRIREWARKLDAVDLVGDVTWHSGVLGRDVSKPTAVCIAGFFNHQTHHRGQIHAMLTAAGQRPGDTDIILMPEDT